MNRLVESIVLFLIVTSQGFFKYKEFSIFKRTGRAKPKKVLKCFRLQRLMVGGEWLSAGPLIPVKAVSAVELAVVSLEFLGLYMLAIKAIAVWGKSFAGFFLQVALHLFDWKAAVWLRDTSVGQRWRNNGGGKTGTAHGPLQTMFPFSLGPVWNAESFIPLFALNLAR